ncbi:hypothetical protein JOQ06_015115, partial [Pogonophryne albipinna]
MDRTSNEVDNSLAESFTFCNEAKDLELFRVSVSYTERAERIFSSASRSVESEGLPLFRR